MDVTCLHIDLDAIVENIRAIRAKSKADVMAIVKANAYGLGAVAVAKALAPECAFFGVAQMAEALELRRAGITHPILILGRIPVSAFRSS